MKNIFGKVMFTLSFIGLFTFVSPKQAKASPSWPRQVWICCPGGSCHCCLCQSEADIDIYKEMLCGISTEPGGSSVE